MIKRYTVKQLIDFLKTQNPKSIVFISSDSEGNCISPFNSVSTGEIGKKIEYYDEIIGYLGDDFKGVEPEDKGKPYICLYPLQ